MAEREDIFEPEKARPQKGQRAAAVVEEAREEDRPPGFPGAKPAFITDFDASGKPTFHIEAAVMSKPITVGGPLVWWEVRQLYFDLGWHGASADLARYLRSKGFKKRMDDMLEFFEVPPNARYQPSRKMMENSNMCVDVLHRDHDTEIMAATAWVVCFLLVTRTSGVKSAQEKGHAHLIAFGKDLKRSVPVLDVGGEALPPCDNPRDATLECHHVKRALKKQETRHGEHWRRYRALDLLWEEGRGKCFALDTLLFQVFWQFVDMLDMMAENGELRKTSEGAPVLKSSTRARRLTKHWATQPGIGITRAVSGAPLTFSAAAPRHSRAAVIEAPIVGKYHAAASAALECSSHVALSPDCLAAPSETLNTAVCLPLDGFKHFWLPLQVTQ